MKHISQYPVNKLVYIDESGIDKFIFREYGWAIKGQKVSGKRYTRESFIAGLNNGKIIAPFCYKGTCDTNLFNFWVSNYLVPALLPGQIVIMDNATFHKSELTKSLIAQANCKLVFLLAYSPDLNPIEKFWANLKNKIKKIISNFSTLADAVDYVFRTNN